MQVSGNKRYYWLKLKEDFFEDDTMAWLEEQENGKDYIIFYLKLCLKSLSEEGYLARYVGERLIPYDVKALAKLTNTSADTVAVAMKLFIEIGLVSQLDSGEIYMNQINEMIGTETDGARRVRKHRAKQKALEQANNNELLQSNSDVTKSNTDIEKEIDKELDKELEKNIVEQSSQSDKSDDVPQIPYKEIVDYLNEKAGRKFKHTTDKTQRLIKARWNEGFELDDFKEVINIKTREWLNDPEMQKYIRPETLFGTKFEGYLNQKLPNNQMTGGTQYDDLF